MHAEGYTSLLLSFMTSTVQQLWKEDLLWAWELVQEKAGESGPKQSAGNSCTKEEQEGKL